MLKETQKVALYMEGHLFSDYGKMGFGVLRYLKNPMVGVIEGFRSCLIGVTPMPWSLIILGTISSFILFVSGCFYFNKKERMFADVA